MVFRTEMWVFILSTAIIAVLMAITWRRRNFSCGRSFLLLMFCAFIWTFTFILEIAAQNLELKLFFAKIQFIAIAFLPLIWLYLMVNYTGRPWPRKVWGLLALIPVLTNIFVWCIPRPNLFWKNPALVRGSEAFSRINYDYGFWFYYVHAPYSYFLILAALIVLFRTIFKTHTIYRYQIMLMATAILLPAVTDILYVLGYSPIKNFNYTTAVFSLSCIIISWALFRYKFLDLLPMARDAVIENMDDGLIVLDIRHRIVDINPSARRITGISGASIGQYMGEVCPGVIGDSIAEIFRRDVKQIEIELGDANGKKIFDLHLSYIKDPLGKVQGSFVTLRDNTERAELINQLWEQAIHDHLTGVFNRRHFIELGRKELSRIKREPENDLSVIMMDLNKFKMINDMYGHAEGDQVLVAFANQCRKIIRSYDIFGRLGGDEFAIILPDTRLDEALITVRRIHESVEKIHLSTPVHIGVSIGTAAYRKMEDSGLELEHLLALADKDMYKSKPP